MSKYILSLDQGTSTSRAVIFDETGCQIAIAEIENELIYPRKRWVEHNPKDLLYTLLSMANRVIDKSGVDVKNILAVGITNQRETTVVWDKDTGQPIYNAIGWQDQRTEDYCNSLIEEGYAKTVNEKTGLHIDAYFSASKLRWILDNVAGAKEKAQNGQLLFGTMDSWLIWKLSVDKLHKTDVTNASRTMLFNIHTLEWDEELLKIFDIPRSMLPEVTTSSEIVAHMAPRYLGKELPISGVVGDQQAALLGNLCIEKGMVKSTYGTGSFTLMNTENKPIASKNLITTIAFQTPQTLHYAIEGSILSGGLVDRWFRDELNIIQARSDLLELAETVEDNGGVYMIPTLLGLGTPHWKHSSVAGSIMGLSLNTKLGHIARASIEARAFQTYTVLKEIEQQTEIPVKSLFVDGSGAKSDLLLQFQADLAGVSVLRHKVEEASAQGVAYLAGIGIGLWSDIKDLKKHDTMKKEFSRNMSVDAIKTMIEKWESALNATVEFKP